MTTMQQGIDKRNQMFVLPGQQAPYSQEAEEAVLGALLTNPDAFLSVGSFLRAEDFYILRHSYIWEAIARIHDRGDKSDYLVVQEEIRALGRYEDIGGAGYLLKLVNDCPSSNHVEIYARLVERAALRRRLLVAADEIKALALEEDLPVEKVEAEAETRLMQAKRSYGGEVKSIRTAVSEHFERTEQAYNHPTNMLGAPSMLSTMNNYTRGFRAKKFYVFAGRPGMGKSSYLLTEAAHMAKSGLRVAFFTMEMPEEEVTNNLIAAEIGIPAECIETGEMDDFAWSKYVEATGRLSQWSFFIDDTAGLTPMMLRNRCRKLVYEHGLDAVFVDYIQLMSGGGEDRYSNRDQEIGYISRSLKGMAKELNIPVIAAAQLNRELERRDDKRPMLSDLRESGNIENDADLVGFFYRDDYYNPPPIPQVVSPTEIAIAKHRGGRRGLVMAGFYGELKKFVALEQGR